VIIYAAPRALIPFRFAFLLLFVDHEHALPSERLATEQTEHSIGRVCRGHDDEGNGQAFYPRFSKVKVSDRISKPF
jgi:hypothetical protein